VRKGAEKEVAQGTRRKDDRGHGAGVEKRRWAYSLVFPVISPCERLLQESRREVESNAMFDESDIMYLEGFRRIEN
jgi:hypothetical protein